MEMGSCDTHTRDVMLIKIAISACMDTLLCACPMEWKTRDGDSGCAADDEDDESGDMIRRKGFCLIPITLWF